MPTIERLTKRGLPEYSLADEFAVGGSSELALLPGSDPPTYRAPFEGGFVRYTWLSAGTGDQGYWRAEYPDGRIGYFGADAQGNIVPEAHVGGPSGTFRYHLTDMTDRFGHVLRDTYGHFGNVTLPQKIAWVFTEGLASAAVYDVTFSYEPRGDKQSDCKPGFEELLEHRLSTVFVNARGNLLRRYVLKYEDEALSGGFTRLQNVQLLGADGVLDDLPAVVGTLP